MRLALLLLAASICWGQALTDPAKGKTTKAEKDSARAAAWKRPTAKVKGKDEPDAAKINELREARIKAGGYDKVKAPKKTAFAPPRWTPTADMPSTVIVFPSRAVADAVMREIAVTPAIEDGAGPVWVWFDPYSEANTIGMSCEPDNGRCAIAHWWALDSIDVAWIRAYTSTWTGIQFLTAIPEDWEREHEL